MMNGHCHIWCHMRSIILYESLPSQAFGGMQRQPEAVPPHTPASGTALGSAHAPEFGRHSAGHILQHPAPPPTPHMMYDNTHTAFQLPGQRARSTPVHLAPQHQVPMSNGASCLGKRPAPDADEVVQQELPEDQIVREGRVLTHKVREAARRERVVSSLTILRELLSLPHSSAKDVVLENAVRHIKAFNKFINQLPAEAVGEDAPK